MAEAAARRHAAAEITLVQDRLGPAGVPLAVLLYGPGGAPATLGAARKV